MRAARRLPAGEAAACRFHQRVSDRTDLGRLRRTGATSCPPWRPRPVAFVTGASRGIGAATALALAAKGYDVAIAARTLREGELHEHGDAAGDAPLPGSLDATADRVRASGARALPLRLDLLEPASHRCGRRGLAEAQLGPIDALVNNAIVQLPGMLARVLETPLDAFSRDPGGQRRRAAPAGAARAAGHARPRARRDRQSRLGAGAMDPPAPTGEGGWGFAYSASKAAFMRLTGVLAVEHKGSGVRFFDVEPGFVLTELMQQSALRDGFAERFGGAPPQVPAAVIAWLLTDPGAESWHGRMVSAQKLCKELALVAGWPRPRGAGLSASAPSARDALRARWSLSHQRPPLPVRPPAGRATRAARAPRLSSASAIAAWPAAVGCRWSTNSRFAPASERSRVEDAGAGRPTALPCARTTSRNAGSSGVVMRCVTPSRSMARDTAARASSSRPSARSASPRGSAPARGRARARARGRAAASSAARLPASRSAAAARRAARTPAPP